MVTTSPNIIISTNDANLNDIFYFSHFKAIYQLHSDKNLETNTKDTETECVLLNEPDTFLPRPEYYP
jgi:hypothetical protein